MSPFPLLRLPRLVLREVFKLLSISGKINLSFCSKKVSALINNDRLYSPEVILGLDIYNQNIEVYSENDEDSFKVLTCCERKMSSSPNIQQYQIEGRIVRVTSISTGIKTFWKNYSEGFLSVIRDLYEPTISELFDLQLEFKRLTILVNGPYGQSLLWNQISDKLGLVEDLEIISVVDPDFIPIFTSWPQKIDIHNSFWFTLETLLECTSTGITLQRSHQEDNDLDEIFRKWKTRVFPNLKYLKIDAQSFESIATTILGMNFSELDGMVIQTDDGSKKATINTSVGSIEMSVTPIE